MLMMLWHKTDNIRLQESARILADLFDSIGLWTTTVKTKAMTCVPGNIQTALLEERYTKSRLGLYTVQEARNQAVTCHKCGKSLKAKSLRAHLETQHGTYQPLLIREEYRWNAGLEPSGQTPMPTAFGIALGSIAWSQGAWARGLDYHKVGPLTTLFSATPTIPHCLHCRGRRCVRQV